MQSNKVQAKEFNAFSPKISPIPTTNDLTNKIDGYPVLNSFPEEQYFMSGINEMQLIQLIFIKEMDLDKCLFKMKL